jgi:hypothetical protein
MAALSIHHERLSMTTATVPDAEARRHSCGYLDTAPAHLWQCKGVPFAALAVTIPAPALEAPGITSADRGTRPYLDAVRAWGKRTGRRVTPVLTRALQDDFDAHHPAPAPVS